MTTLADLLAPLAASDFVKSAKITLAGLGLLPSSWLATDPEDALLNATGQTVASQWNATATASIQSGFLDTAALIGNPLGISTIPASKWMKFHAATVFNVAAIEASFATGGWTGTNSTGGNIGPFSPGQLKFYSLDNNAIVYSNRDTVTFVPGANQPITIVADTIGSGSNAAPSRVAMLTTILGISGANALTISGLDAESGPALAARCRLKYFSLSPNGPAQAYQYIALTPSLNGGIAVNRVWVSPSSTNGSVTVILAGPSGPISNPADVTTVDAALRSKVLPGAGVVSLTTKSATANTIPVTWTAYYHSSAGIDAPTEQANGNAALVALFSSLPIGGENIAGGGGFVYKDRLIGALQIACPKAFQIIIVADTLGGLSIDVPIGPLEVPTLGTLTPLAVVVT